MSINNTGGVPGVPNVPGAQPPAAPPGSPGAPDGEAFDKALHTEADAGGEADALPGPEQELRKIIAEQSMKQFMERSQELAQETKKNLEG